MWPYNILPQETGADFVISRKLFLILYGIGCLQTCSYCTNRRYVLSETKTPERTTSYCALGTINEKWDVKAEKRFRSEKGRQKGHRRHAILVNPQVPSKYPNKSVHRQCFSVSLFQNPFHPNFCSINSFRIRYAAARSTKLRHWDFLDNGISIGQ